VGTRHVSRDVNYVMKRSTAYLFAAVLLAGVIFFVFNLSWIGDPLKEAASSRFKSKGKGKGLSHQSPMSSPAKSPLAGHKSKPTEKVHIFYYPWYSNPDKDPVHAWNHWNHNIIPHWYVYWTHSNCRKYRIYASNSFAL
jgi:hypothetical protein